MGGAFLVLVVVYLSPMATGHAKYIAPVLKTNICPSS